MVILQPFINCIVLLALRTVFLSLNDLLHAFECLKRLADESRADETLVVSLWKHEMQRVMRDRICRHADLSWFDENLDGVVKEVK